MSQHDDDRAHDGASPLSDSQPHTRGAVSGADEPTRLVPLLVELASDYVGVVWVRASRSELVTGTVFTAHGRRWKVTGLSASGVTYRCREVKDE
jgi:hypothetical protein